MNTEIFDVIETAKYLKISTKKVYQLVKGNEIPYKRIGGQYRFIKSQIDEWILKQPSVKICSAAHNNIHQLISKAKEINDKLKRQLFVVGIFTKELAKYNLKPVVVGGFAVEFYTIGGYNTGDIDLVFSDNELLGKILCEIGFVKAGRHWINKDLDIYIEAPGSQLSAGESAHLVEVEIEGLKTYIIGVEDLIIDRLNAYVHWKSTDEGNWIKELILINYDNVDWSYLEARSIEEKTYEALLDLKREVEIEKDKL